MAVHAATQSIPFLLYCPLHAFSVALFLFVPVSLPFVRFHFELFLFPVFWPFFPCFLFLFPWFCCLFPGLSFFSLFFGFVPFSFFFLLRFVAFFLLSVYTFLFPSVCCFFLPFVAFSALSFFFFPISAPSSVILAFSSWVSSPEPVSVVFLVPAFDLLCTKKPPCPQVRSALHCAWPVGKLIGLVKII